MKQKSHPTKEDLNNTKNTCSLSMLIPIVQHIEVDQAFQASHFGCKNPSIVNMQKGKATWNLSKKQPKKSWENFGQKQITTRGQVASGNEPSEKY
jgi:hypothetical protein